MGVAPGVALGNETTAVSRIEPSELPRCVVMVGNPPGQPEPPPDFPFNAWKNAVRGEVQAELRFLAADQPPEVTLQVSISPPRPGQAEESPDELGTYRDALRRSVEAHLQKLRLPCQAQQSTPTVLRRVYEFRPSLGGYMASATIDAADQARQARTGCLRHVKGEQRPEYPAKATRAEIDGYVIVKLRFESPDAPPVIQDLFARPKADPLARSVEDFTKGLRMPCLGSAPDVITQVYRFRFEGEATGLRPLTLRQLLSVDERLSTDGLTLDTRPMGCPFDIHLWYRQPYMPNAVTEIGPTQASRQPLLDYLRGVKIAGPAAVQDAIFGDSTTVTVQCLDIAIPPKEKRS